jgi:integrase
VVRRGKGGKGRRVSFDPKTGRSIDRYLRARRTHRLAETPTLWLGDRGKNLGYYGLRDTLQWRAGLAGIENFTNHQLRHTFAALWLDKGGSEGGLMASAGWTRRDMIDRYVKSTSERRAADESRRLAIGDQF